MSYLGLAHGVDGHAAVYGSARGRGHGQLVALVAWLLVSALPSLWPRHKRCDMSNNGGPTVGENDCENVHVIAEQISADLRTNHIARR